MMESIYTIGKKAGMNGQTVHSLEFSSLKFEISFYVITQPKYVDSNCNALIFVNQGTSVAVLDSAFTIAPGESFSIPAEILERCVHHWNISFSTGGTNNLIMVRKIYQ